MSRPESTGGSPSEPSSEAASAVLMVRPVRFRYNPETAETNFFQVAPDDLEAVESNALAARQFDSLAEALRRTGVRVVVVSGRAEAPDSVFPNNWVSFHEDGTVVLYPMLAPSRRLEVRGEIIERLAELGIVTERRRLDLRHYESRGQYLEGTGSMVLDRRERVAYACLSPRTSAPVLEDWSRELEFTPVAFRAVDRVGREIYHTNVLMGIGTRFVVICSEAISDPRERGEVLARLRATGRRVIEIDFAQMHRFAGNLLEVRGKGGRAYVVLSKAARDSLRADQREALECCGTILAEDLSVIESLGGGSARCMIAEAAWS